MYRLCIVCAVALLMTSSVLVSCNTQQNIEEGTTPPALITTSFETTTEETTPEETTPEVTTPAVTEPDFSNTPDPDGTKRY